MTIEQMAKEWIKKNTVEFDDEELGLVCIREPSSEDCFLAGFEAGKLKWHDLRKNPDDLPPMYDLSAPLAKNVFLKEVSMNDDLLLIELERLRQMLRIAAVDVSRLAGCDAGDYLHDLSTRDYFEEVTDENKESAR